MIENHTDKQGIADTLAEPVREAGNLARTFGLDPYDVNYWVVDYDEMNELIAYGGFQERYPHWRWGMQYDRQQKQSQFLGGKAFEIVNNDDPANAFLQASNSLADQKAVITHVEAHADFFANNEWFGLFTARSAETALEGADGGERRQRTPDATAMLARHADAIEAIMSDPAVDRGEVEKWIDHVLTLEDNIDQHVPYEPIDGRGDRDAEREAADLGDQLDELDLSAEVKGQVFSEEWLDDQRDGDGSASFPAEPEADLIGFLCKHGMQYDEEAGRAAEMTDWQTDVLEMLRRESYYFAPQKMTRVMNEGWASYHESNMMAGENFAGDDEFVTYADHMARVLGSPGLNPYKLGLELWQYVENTENRREVVERLLRVEGITWRNFHDEVDFDAVLDTLAPDPVVAAVGRYDLDELDPADPRIDAAALDRAKTARTDGRDGGDTDGTAGETGPGIDVETYPWKLLTEAGMAERHYSLTQPQNRGFLAAVGQAALERTARYLFDDARYATVDEALADVDYTRGWDRLFEIRESHNDVTFLDEFLTQEFVDENDYFTYEYTHANDDYRVTSTDYEDVKKKLMLEFTNFGKPTIVVEDGNYNNRNELLLAHRYNGVMLDRSQAAAVLERVFELWGRPVNLKTIVTEFDEHDVEVARRRDSEPEPEEVGRLLRFDGTEVTREELPWSAVSHLAADDVDYDTKPDEWVA
jgi:stage V sporulation protein R